MYIPFGSAITEKINRKRTLDRNISFSYILLCFCQSLNILWFVTIASMIRRNVVRDKPYWNTHVAFMSKCLNYFSDAFAKGFDKVQHQEMFEIPVRLNLSEEVSIIYTRKKPPA